MTCSVSEKSVEWKAREGTSSIPVKYEGLEMLADAAGGLQSPLFFYRINRIARIDRMEYMRFQNPVNPRDPVDPV